MKEVGECQEGEKIRKKEVGENKLDIVIIKMLI